MDEYGSVVEVCQAVHFKENSILHLSLHHMHDTMHALIIHLKIGRVWVLARVALQVHVSNKVHFH